MAEKELDETVLVVAFDIGTSYSGYAYSFRKDLKLKPPVIFSNAWTESGAHLVSHKAPTTVLLKYPTFEFHSFGYDAETKFADIVEKRTNISDWCYVYEFKMSLSKEIDRNSMIDDILGRPVPVKHVFAETIRFLNSHMLSVFEKKGVKTQEKDIQYVITVPAIWSDAAKQLMREAAAQAGLHGSNIKLAYEPEAAALHCRSLSAEKLTGCSSNDALFVPGTTFMVLDLGGGTADLTVQRIGSDGKLNQVHRASGGGWGGTRVNHCYYDLLLKLVGDKVMHAFCKECMAEYIHMLRSFELKKRSIQMKDKEVVIIRVPSELAETFKEIMKLNLNEHIEKTEYKGRICYKRGKLEIDAEISKAFFDYSLNGIVKHVRSVLKLPQCKNVDFMLLVGGFSESPIVNEAIREKFPHIRVISPVGDECGLAVLKGATLFGMDPDIVNSRASPYTFGVALHRNVTGFSPPNVREPVSLGQTFMVSGEIHAMDTFHKFFTINEIVVVGSKRKIPVRNMTITQSEETRRNPKEIKVYSSTDENPKFVTDSGCKFHGVIIVPPPNGRWPDNAEGEIELEMGATDMFVRYVDKSKKYSITGSIDFLSRPEQVADARPGDGDCSIRFQRQFALALESTTS